MPNPINVPITPPRVPFIDARNGNVSREWYLFFLSLYQLTSGSGVSLDDVQKGPPTLTIDEVQKQIQGVQSTPREELGTMAAVQQDNTRFIGFSTNPSPDVVSDTGVMCWNTVDQTLNLGMDYGVTQQIGQETYARVQNSTGTTIPNGTAVGFAGATSDALLVAPYIADGSQPTLYILGIMTHDLPDSG